MLAPSINPDTRDVSPAKAVTHSFYIISISHTRNHLLAPQHCSAFSENNIVTIQIPIPPLKGPAFSFHTIIGCTKGISRGIYQYSHLVLGIKKFHGYTICSIDSSGDSYPRRQRFLFIIRALFSVDGDSAIMLACKVWALE
jgi:hypothetical protein